MKNNNEVPNKFQLEIWSEIVEGAKQSEGYRIAKDGDDIKLYHKPKNAPYAVFNESKSRQMTLKEFKRLWDAIVKAGALKKDYSKVELSKGGQWDHFTLKVEDKLLIHYGNHILSDEGGKLFLLLWKKVNALQLKNAAYIDTSRIPDNLEFFYGFGDIYHLIKARDCICVGKQATWEDASRPPTKDFDGTSSFFLITPEDFKPLWEKIIKLDFLSFSIIKSEDFSYFAPGCASSTLLRIVINSINVVNSFESYKNLSDDKLKAPLQEITGMIQKLLDLRSENIIVPRTFAMTVENFDQRKTANITNQKYFLRKESDGSTILEHSTASGGQLTKNIAKINREDFEEFYKELLKMKLFHREFELNGLVPRDGKFEFGYGMEIEINEQPFVKFLLPFEDDNPGLTIFNMVRSLIEKMKN